MHFTFVTVVILVGRFGSIPPPVTFDENELVLETIKHSKC